VSLPSPGGERVTPTKAEGSRGPKVEQWLTVNLSNTTNNALRALAQNLFCERYVDRAGDVLLNGAETM